MYQMGKHYLSMVESFKVEMLEWYDVSSGSYIGSYDSSVSLNNAAMHRHFKGRGFSLTGVEVNSPKSAGTSVLIPNTSMDALT